MDTNIKITVALNELVLGLDKVDAANLIEAIDLEIAECDFTLEFLNKAIKSLEADMSREDIAKELGFKL